MLTRNGKRGFERRKPIAIMIGRDLTKPSAFRQKMYSGEILMAHEMKERAPVDSMETTSADASR